jgi:hypothetical protein
VESPHLTDSGLEHLSALKSLHVLELPDSSKLSPSAVREFINRYMSALCELQLYGAPVYHGKSLEQWRQKTG